MLIFISAIDALPICMESEFETGPKKCANCAGSILGELGSCEFLDAIKLHNKVFFN